MVNTKTVDRIGSELHTDQHVMEHSNLLDESGNMMPPVNTVRGIEISNNGFAIAEEKDENDPDESKKAKI